MPSSEESIRPEVSTEDQLFRIFSDPQLNRFSTTTLAQAAQEIVPAYLPAFSTWDKEKQGQYLMKLVWAAGQPANPTGSTNVRQALSIMQGHAETAGHRMPTGQALAETLQTGAEIGGAVAMAPEWLGGKALIGAASRVPAAAEFISQSPRLASLAKFLMPAAGAVTATAVVRPGVNALLESEDLRSKETLGETMETAGVNAIGGEAAGRLLMGVARTFWKSGLHPLRNALAEDIAGSFRSPRFAMNPRTIEGVAVLQRQGVTPLVSMLSDDASIQLPLVAASLGASKTSWIAGKFRTSNAGLREFEVLQGAHDAANKFITDIVQASGAKWTRQTLTDPEQLANEIRQIITTEREFADMAGHNLYQGVDAVIASAGNPRVIKPVAIQEWYKNAQEHHVHLLALMGRLRSVLSPDEMARAGFRVATSDVEVAAAKAKFLGENPGLSSDVFDAQWESKSRELFGDDASFYDLFKARSVLLKIGRGKDSDPVVRTARSLAPKVTQVLREQTDNIEPGLFAQFEEATTFWRKNQERLRNKLVNKFMDVLESKPSSFINVVDKLQLDEIKAIRKSMGVGKAGREQFENKFQNIAALSVMFRSRDRLNALTPKATPGLYQLEPDKFFQEIVQLPLGRGNLLFGKTRLDSMKAIANAYEVASRTAERPAGMAMMLHERATITHFTNGLVAPSKIEPKRLAMSALISWAPAMFSKVLEDPALTQAVVHLIGNPPKSIPYEKAIKALVGAFGQGAFIVTTLPDPVSSQTETMLSQSSRDAMDAARIPPWQTAQEQPLAPGQGYRK